MTEARENRSCKRRAGVTLIEVLVSIFVMGIGLLAIMVLFPLGALNMATAIRADRAANAGLNATAIAKILPHNSNGTDSPNYRNVRSDPDVTPFYGAGNPGPGFTIMVPGISYNKTYTVPPTGSASYPVFVDPIGAQKLLSQAAGTAGILGTPPPQMRNAIMIPRVGLSYFDGAPYNTASSITRWFTFLDDITFLDNGLPDIGSTNGNKAIQREGRFSWAYMVQQPRYVNPDTWNRNVHLWVLVYDRRPFTLDSNGQPAGEKCYQAVFTAQNNVVQVSWDPTAPNNQEPPPIRKGSWILDGTINSASDIHGFFYRVVGVNPGDTPNSLNLEIQSNAIADANPGVCVVLENVVEVLPRGSN